MNSYGHRKLRLCSNKRYELHKQHREPTETQIAELKVSLPMGLYADASVTTIELLHFDTTLLS